MARSELQVVNLETTFYDLGSFKDAMARYHRFRRALIETSQETSFDSVLDANAFIDSAINEEPVQIQVVLRMKGPSWATIGANADQLVLEAATRAGILIVHDPSEVPDEGRDAYETGDRQVVRA